MFGFLKKRKYKLPKDYELEARDFIFLENLVKILPKKFSFLQEHINKEFLLNKSKMLLKENGNISFGLDEELFHKYKRESFADSSKILNIEVRNKITFDIESINIHLLNGVFWGYYLNPATKFEDLDFNNFNIQNIRFLEFKNENKVFLKNLIGGVSNDLLSKLDLESTFKIEIEEGDFYVIKNLGDGNYLSMDNKGAVYGMIHDPYEIEQIFNNKEKFFEALKSGEFNINDYYERKVNAV